MINRLLPAALVTRRAHNPSARVRAREVKPFLVSFHRFLQDCVCYHRLKHNAGFKRRRRGRGQALTKVREHPAELLMEEACMMM